MFIMQNKFTKFNGEFNSFMRIKETFFEKLRGKKICRFKIINFITK